jgi:hypothetical protein
MKSGPQISSRTLDGTRALLEIVATPPQDWLKFDLGRLVRETMEYSSGTSDTIMLLRTQVSLLEEVEIII